LPTQERSRRTVAAILDAAAHVLAERGDASATTTNHIAEAAGVSIGSLYQYFADRDEILLALYERHLDVVAEPVLAAARAAPGRSAREWAAGFVRTLVAVNDDVVAPLLFDAVSPPVAVRERVHGLLIAVAGETEPHLAGWGVAQPARRARLLVTTALAGVHEVVIRAPAGPCRSAEETDLVDLLVAFVQTAR
jgi:AcrR family transcriptional regulator